MHRRSAVARGEGAGVGEERSERQGDEDYRQKLLHTSNIMTAANKVAAEEEDDKKDPMEDRELGKFGDTGLGICCGPVTSPLQVIIKLVVCALAGMIFGLALEKGRVFEPEAIRKQMVFEQWTMFKMFFAAMGAGQFLLAFMSVLPRFRGVFTAAIITFLQSQGDNGVLRAIVGPFILGCGMSVAGACPGMVLAQVGSNTKNAIFTLIGALAAALLFGLIGGPIIRILKPKKDHFIHSIHDMTGIFYAWIAFPMSICVLGAVVLMEVFIPWHDDLPVGSQNPMNITSNVITHKAWPPSVAGAIIGCLQVVVAFAVQDTLGGSSAYMTIMSQLLFHKKLQHTWPRFAKYKCGIGNWWQVFYIVFAMVGSFLSSFASHSTSTTPGVTLPTAVIGGFLMLFGARIGSGCTSGHGLSGAALLMFWSITAVPAMFAGGIATAFGMRGFGLLNQYICMDGSVCTGNNYMV